MRTILLWAGGIVGVFIVAVAAMIVVGAMLPVHHVASRTENFAPSQEKLYSLAIAEFHRTNEHGNFAIVEETPPSRFVTAIVKRGLPFGGRWTFDFSADGSGTTLTITEHGEVYNPFFRFVSRFIVGHTASIDEFMEALRKETGPQAK